MINRKVHSLGAIRSVDDAGVGIATSASRLLALSSATIGPGYSTDLLKSVS